MNDAEYNRLKEELDGLVDLWKERLKLAYWRISCCYYRSPSAFEAGAPPDVGQAASACCDAKWQYFDACLHFNVERIFAANDSHEDREEIVVHELCHCVLDELYKSAASADGNTAFEKAEWSAHNERVTSHMTHVILSAYRPHTVEGEY